jgi:hypothetical protein
MVPATTNQMGISWDTPLAGFSKLGNPRLLNGGFVRKIIEPNG